VKLLLDENVSPRIIPIIADLYPGSIHVRDAGLASASDAQVWKYASENGYVIATKDSDFHQRSLLFGIPPKVVWIRRGNLLDSVCSRDISQHSGDITRFVDDADAAFLVIE